VSDPELTPDEEQVRRLLADARHDEPLPADVADRLDRVLGELREEGRRTPAPVDLAARRRRRLARNLLVAAAAVVVVGVGIRAVDLEVDGDAGGAGDASSAMESAPDADEGGDVAGDRALIIGPTVVLSSDDLERQVRRLSRADGLRTQSGTAPSAPTNGYLGEEEPLEQDSSASGARSWCADPGWGAGGRIAVRYDGERGVLVLRAPVGDTRDVDLFLCGETVPTRSLTVPVG
jgi:hypothetical protein